MCARYLCPLALLYATAAAAQTTEKPQQPDVVSYVARVEPNLATKSVSGSARIRLVAQSGATSFAFDAGELTIDAVRENGAAVPFEKHARQLVVTLPGRGELVDRREIEIEVDYRGTPRKPGLILGLLPGGACRGKIGRASCRERVLCVV